MPHLYKAYGVAEYDDDGGIIKGYASTFDRIPDSYGDVVKAGAFADTLKRWEEGGNRIPLLFGHRTDDPKYNIGYLTEAREDERGLYVEAALDPDNETAQYARKLAQQKRIYQFSFAYDVLERADAKLDSGVFANELVKVELYEVSLVQIPANPRAEVTDVKADEPAEAHQEAETKDELVADEQPVMEKSGRRNSRKDEDAMRDAIAHLNKAIALLDGIVGGDLDEHGPDSAEGGEGDASPKGREADEDVLELYKDAVKSMFGGKNGEA